MRHRMEHSRIAPDVELGSGAVVAKDVPSRILVLGNPDRPHGSTNLLG